MVTELIVEGPLFICAGEASGDLYASLLVKQLKKMNPWLTIFGVGGERMRQSGVEVVEDYGTLNTFGFASGLSSSLRNYCAYKKIARKLYRVRAKTFIAVAYPGVNLLLCRYAKKLCSKVYYYLPPQIWAWGEFRKYFIKKWVDSVISVFPFEHQFYRNKGMKVYAIENPLFEELEGYKRNNFQNRIGFMPGSRISEMKRNLPVMIEVMKKIWQENPPVVFSLILHSRKEITNHKWLMKMAKTLKTMLANNIEIVTENHYQTMRNCDLLIVCSGTASFEAVIMNVPQIFFNRPSLFDFFISKRFVKIKEYNLANLYFSKTIVPSFISPHSHFILQNVTNIIKNFNFVDELCDFVYNR